MSPDTAEKTQLAGTRTAKKSWWPALAVVVAAILVVVVAYWLAHSVAQQQLRGGGRFGGRGGNGPGGAAMPVGVAAAAKGDIDITLNALGTVMPLRNVTVTAQVSGQLTEVRFKEGQVVSNGDLLAQIDPRPYQAALEQAEGASTRDHALLAEAKIDLDRYQTLFKEDSIAKQQLDAQQSLVHQYEGTTKSDQGQIKNATVNLAYTRIVAPISGRVGLRQVDPGNNVQNGSGIVLITQLKPIDVLFALPEDNLPAVLQKMRAGTPLSVVAYDRSGQTRLAGGTLASLDNTVDTSTGTVKAKAEFANDDESLFPNQFVNVRLLLDVMHDAIVIPTSALERGSGGLFVYVVQPDHTVVVRTIKTGPTQGERVAVTEGLSVGEVVVTSGADRLREGSKVELPSDQPQPSAASEVPPSGGDQTSGGRHHWGQGQGQSGQHGQWQGHHRHGANAPNGNPSGKPGDAPDKGGKPAGGGQP